VPTQFVESALFRVLFSFHDPYVFLFGDRSFRFVSDLGPLSFWNHWLQQPIHIQSVIVNASEINISGHLPIFERSQEMIGTGFDQRQIADAIKVLIIDGDRPSSESLFIFLLHNLFHDILPGSRDEFGVAGREISAGDLNVDGWLAMRFVSGVE